MSEDARGGIRRGEVGLFVTQGPGNKMPGVYVMRGNVLHKVAYFKAEGDARLFLEALNYIAFGEDMED